jgi:L-lysine exporter family protein LysE/ArgO
MLSAFLEGFMLGLGAAVPVGPINILIMTNAIKNYKNALSIGFGAMSADITYLALILLGLFAFVKNETFQMILGVFGSLFLTYIAYLIFKNRNEKIELDPAKIKDGHTKIVANYIKGYSLTLLNPYTIGFWISVSAYISTKNLSFGFTLLGLFSGIFLWITLMPYAVHKTKHLLSNNMTKNISVIASGIILFFAIGMIINLTKG